MFYGKLRRMSWLKDLVRPKIATQKRREVAESVWETCPACGQMLYHRDLEQNQAVCTSCGHHLRFPLAERLVFLLDEGATPIEVAKPTDDPLKFKDRKRYSERLSQARHKTKQDDAYQVVKGAIDGQPLVVVALDFGFMAGSMSRQVGQAVVTAAQTAMVEKLPLLVITASGGARMQEGVFSLMQMARTTAALADLKEAKVPYIVLLTDPTTGGVTASFAMQGDVILAEPGALIGFAGPRVIRETIGETLPEGFQKAEYLRDHGMVDQVVARSEQRRVLANLLSLLNSSN